MMVNHPVFNAYDELMRVDVVEFESTKEQTSQEIQERSSMPLTYECLTCAKNCKIHSAFGLLAFYCADRQCFALILLPKETP
jgi:hypothetical protein